MPTEMIFQTVGTRQRLGEELNTRLDQLPERELVGQSVSFGFGLEVAFRA
jgi:hypothetical protein